MALTTYVDTSGAFTNGVTPLSAANMNPIRNFLTATGAMWDSNISADGNGVQTLVAHKVNPTSAALAGATSGTATFYQPERGTWKVVYILLNNFWNTGGSVQTQALNTAFTSSVYVRTTALFQIELRVSGSAQTINILTALGAAGGTTTTQTNIAGSSQGWCNAAVDTIGFRSGGSGAVNGLIILEGI